MLTSVVRSSRGGRWYGACGASEATLEGACSGCCCTARLGEKSDICRCRKPSLAEGKRSLNWGTGKRSSNESLLATCWFVFATTCTLAGTLPWTLACEFAASAAGLGALPH